MSERAASFGGLKDFSVDSQRKMFIEAQTRERQVAEDRRASRKIKAASSKALQSDIALSGMMASVEKKRPVGEHDDDDSLEDYSVDSEESFYVGIERADYAQPDNLELYGEEKNEMDFLTEDLLGISRVSVAIINRQNGATASKWDEELIIRDEKSTSLHEFMNGTSGATNKGRSTVVAKPMVDESLNWNEDSKLGDDDGAIDQVYQHEAAEGKAFIEQLVGSSATPGTNENGSLVGDLARATSAGATSTRGITPGPTSAVKLGSMPILSPLQLFSPGMTPARRAGEQPESNAVRQMREREIRKDAREETDRKMRALKALVDRRKDDSGKVDVAELMQQMEKMLSA